MTQTLAPPPVPTGEAPPGGLPDSRRIVRWLIPVWCVAAIALFCLVPFQSGEGGMDRAGPAAVRAVWEDPQYGGLERLWVIVKAFPTFLCAVALLAVFPFWARMPAKFLSRVAIVFGSASVVLGIVDRLAPPHPGALQYGYSIQFLLAFVLPWWGLVCLVSRRPLLPALAPVLTLALGVACTFVGLMGLTERIWELRVSRVVVAAVVGAGLAISGLALQGLLRNPLADPYVLGISSGAGVGYLVGLSLAAAWGISELATTSTAALAGAVLTSAVVYLLAQRRGRLDPYVLLLSGVIVNVLNGAIILSILIFLRPNQLATYIGWGIGQVPDNLLQTRPALVAACAAAMLGGWAMMLVRAGAMNVLGLGDEVAASSGVSVHGLRIETFLIVSLMTAAAVALAGPVGFVGLVIPHVCRLAAGPDHRRLAVLSGFVGAAFLMAADTFCRTAGQWFAKGEIPLGVVTALVGGPAFIFLLRRHGREGKR